MALLNFEHLFEQAESLVSSPTGGPRRQVDLRRAISTAYYGLFHFTLTRTADEFISVGQRTSNRYALAYRSIDHRTFRDLCIETTKRSPSARFSRHVPSSGWVTNIRDFAVAAIGLQEKRHVADYDPRPLFTSLNAKTAVQSARDAVRHFDGAGKEDQKTFLTCLLCPPR